MAKSPTVVAPWEYLGGTSRRYWNPTTGETISRERYDSLYGSLFRRGARSFKRASAAVPEEVRQARPARGRGGKTRRQGVQGISGLKPLIGRMSRNVTIPFEVIYDGDLSDLLKQTEDYRDDYNEAIKRIQGNKRIFAVSLIADYANPSRGTSGFYTITRAEHASSISTFDEFTSELGEKLYPGDECSTLAFHLRFKGEYIVPAKYKALKVRKRKAK